MGTGSLAGPILVIDGRRYRSLCEETVVMSRGWFIVPLPAWVRLITSLTGRGKPCLSAAGLTGMAATALVLPYLSPIVAEHEVYLSI